MVTTQQRVVVSGAAIMAMLGAGCAPVRMQIESPMPMCREVQPSGVASIIWITPFNAGDRKNLRSWCDAVGPVAMHDAGARAAGGDRAIAIVSWNMAVGQGNLEQLLKDVRSGRDDLDVVLLLQEAYRAKAVPPECPPGSGRADAIGHPRPAGSEDILDLAKRLGLYAVYAPSMRNGTECARDPREDRGNAIVSTLPLSTIAVVELPFAQQRRVAIAASVKTAAGPLGVVTTHFDTLLGHKRMAEAISQMIEILGWKSRFVIGGDLNSAIPADSGLREMRKWFARLDCGSGPTHEKGGRLDHLFVGRLDTPFPCRIGSERHGSDHSPLIAVAAATLFK